MADLNKLFSLQVPRGSFKAITLETGEPASAWTNQHGSRDAVTERVFVGLSMDEEDAGLTDDDHLSPSEEVYATADEAIEDAWPGRNTSRSHENKD